MKLALFVLTICFQTSAQTWMDVPKIKKALPACLPTPPKVPSQTWCRERNHKLFHPNAESCYRSFTPAGQQCCYQFSGPGNGTLSLIPRGQLGAGSKDIFGPAAGTDRKGYCVNGALRSAAHGAIDVLPAVPATIGQHAGAGGWHNNSPVSRPRVENNGRVRVDCCRCDVAFYQDDSYFKDSSVSRRPWHGTIQQGNFETGNCAQKMRLGRQDGGVPLCTEHGYKIYYQYENCRRVTVAGSRCPASSLSFPKESRRCR